MKQFFGGCLGAFIGVLLGIIILAVVMFAAITSSISGTLGADKREKTEKINLKGPVMRIDLSGEIYDTPKKNWFSNFNFDDLFKDKDIILPQLVRTIEYAKQDNKIKGIYIRMYNFNASVTQLEEIRKAIKDFRSSGKWVYVYADSYFQGAYYLASAANKITMHPQGMFLWKGLASQITFYKKALDKLDIQVQVFRHGKFKSAVEPFILEKMSDENKHQMRTLLNSVWNTMLANISEDRKISIQELNNYANNLDTRDAELTLKYKFIDLISDETQVESIIAEQIKKDKDQLFTDYHLYKKNSNKLYAEESTDKIAIVYASGQIADEATGSNSDDIITPIKLLSTLKKVEDNTKIKAVVLRVNSPGGSAFASDIIWGAIKKLKAKKPVVVSFGDVAASGGYYISCGADYIFTDKNTITGSIGVFGLMPNFQTLMQKDLGLNTDTVKTNTYADFMSVLRPIQPKEYEAIMYGIEKVYKTFLSRVSEGRKLRISYIDSIGQGRVWSGSDAVQLKLADKTGTLEDAIAYAASKVGLKNFDIDEYPKIKPPFQQFLDNMNDGALEEKILKTQTGPLYKDILFFKQLLKDKQFTYLSLLPYQIKIN